MQHPPRNIDKTCFSWVKLILKTDLPPLSKYTALYLSTFMNLNQDMAFPSLKRIQSDTGMAHATVLKHLETLVTEGWLVKQSGNAVTSNRYWIGVPNASEIRVGQEMTYVSSGEEVGQELTSNNNRITNTLSRERGGRFIKPTVEQVRGYCLVMQYDIDAETFIAWNESKGWKVGNSPMKCWKSALTTWSKRRNIKNTVDKGSTRHRSLRDDLSDTSWA